MADAFISYARKDSKDFVRKLHAALCKLNRDIWVDWEDIPHAVPWREEIFDNIERSEAFVFVISPYSIRSPYCAEELVHAIKHNKRLIPIVHLEVSSKDVVEPLRVLNWIYFRDNNFDRVVQDLLEAIDTDPDHIRTHTSLLIRAIEWEKKDRDSSFLLRGMALGEAEDWLTQCAQKEPKPTELHREYISASLTVETASIIYWRIVGYLNQISRLISDIRRSRQHIFSLPIEWAIYLIVTFNILLVGFDITYVPLRDFYFLQAPSITQVYDPIKGIEPQRDTEQYLQRVEELKSQISETGLQSPEVETILQNLRDYSREMIKNNPFQYTAKYTKGIGTLEKIKNRMRKHMGIESAQGAFRNFWSKSHLNPENFSQELSFFSRNIQPALETNYYRNHDENGQLYDEFWKIDCIFIAIFAIELWFHALYLSQKLDIPFEKALCTRWYDFFWLTFTVYWSWLRLLRLIPFGVRSYQLGVWGSILHIKGKAFQLIITWLKPMLKEGYIENKKGIYFLIFYLLYLASFIVN
jgi:hypothetical protein